MSRSPSRLLAALLSLVAACSDQPRSTAPLAPTAGPRAALASAPACAKADALFLSQEIATLFSDPKLRQTARGYESTVEARCRITPPPLAYPAATLAATLATAPAAALAYTEWLLGQRGQTGYVASDAFLWTYLTRLFGYVGYTIPPLGTGFGLGGFVRVCHSGTECQIESADGRRGIRLPANALSLTAGIPFLVTGEPRDCSPFQSFSSYAVYSGCIDISVDPKPGTSFTLQAPGTLVEMCTTTPGTPSYVTERRQDVYTGVTTTQGKLGQRSQAAGNAFTPIAFRPFAAGFLDDFWCGNDKPLTATVGAMQRIRRAGDALLALFRPAVAHAGHGGLGTLPGLIDELSVFGPLDGYAFNGDFEPDTVGTFPHTWPEMRAGTWTLSLGPTPSRASVQAPTPPFATQHLRLDQGGGAAANKDPLVFTGTLAVAMAPQPGDGDRRIRLRVRAAIATARGLDARFEARTSAGATFAAFEFRDGTSAQSGTIVPLVPGGATVIGAVGSAPWSQNAVRSLQVTVHFDVTNGIATVSVGLAGEPPLAHYTLPGAALPDLAGFRWVLGGRDGVTVLSDDYQAFDAPAGLP